MRRITTGIALVTSLVAVTACSSTSDGGPSRNIGSTPVATSPVPQPAPGATVAGNGLVTRLAADEEGVVSVVDTTGPTGVSTTTRADGRVDARTSANFRSGGLVPTLTGLREVEEDVFANTAGEAFVRDGGAVAPGSAIVQGAQDGDFFFAESLYVDPQGGFVDYGIGYRASNKSDPVQLGSKRSASYTGRGTIFVAGVDDRLAGEVASREGTATLTADFDAGRVNGAISTQATDGTRDMVTLSQGSIAGSDFFGGTTYSTSSNVEISGQRGDYIGSFTGRYGETAGGVVSGEMSVGDTPLIYGGTFVVQEKR